MYIGHFLMILGLVVVLLSAIVPYEGKAKKVLAYLSATVGLFMVAGGTYLNIAHFFATTIK